MVCYDGKSLDVAQNTFWHAVAASGYLATKPKYIFKKCK